MRLDTPEHIEDLLVESLEFAREEVTDRRVKAACDGFAHLMTAEVVDAPVYVEAYNKSIKGSRWADSMQGASPVRTVAGTIKDEDGYSIDGYLTPPPRMLMPYMNRALELANTRGPFATADFMTKLHPFYKGNGTAARMLFLALSERNQAYYEAFEEQDIREVLDAQRQWVSQSYPRAAGKSLDQYYTGASDGWAWGLILDIELGDR